MHFGLSRKTGEDRHKVAKLLERIGFPELEKNPKNNRDILLAGFDKHGMMSVWDESCIGAKNFERKGGEAFWNLFSFLDPGWGSLSSEKKFGGWWRGRKLEKFDEHSIRGVATKKFPILQHLCQNIPSPNDILRWKVPLKKQLVIESVSVLTALPEPICDAGIK